MSNSAKKYIPGLGTDFYVTKDEVDFEVGAGGDEFDPTELYSRIEAIESAIESLNSTITSIESRLDELEQPDGA